MKEGPDISIVAALIGNPACANMLTALLLGPALTATELAQEAGLSLSTVSGHLDRLEKASLVSVERQGRHRIPRDDYTDAVGLECGAYCFDERAIRGAQDRFHLISPRSKATAVSTTTNNHTRPSRRRRPRSASQLSSWLEQCQARIVIVMSVQMLRRFDH